MGRGSGPGGAEKRAKRRNACVAQRGLVWKLGEQIFTGSRGGVFRIIILHHVACAVVICVGTPRLERRFLGCEVAGGVEHEAHADVETARAV